MISNTYDLKEFLEAIVDGNYQDILEIAEQEHSDAESRPYSLKGNIRYAQMLNNFIFFLQHGMRPEVVSDQEFALYLPICEALVKKKQLSQSVLALFKK